MKFIEEVVVDAFLPTVRSMLANALRERGLTQREVADKLGISQSAVSKYAHGDVATVSRLRSDERIQTVIDEVADGLASGEMSSVQALIELEVLIRQLERGDILAQLHQETMPGLDASASESIHAPEGELRSTERVLASVRRGLKILKQTKGVASLLPNVGGNLVESVPDPAGIEDVAGVPGRLFAVKNQLSVPAEPEFGASEHVATLLLAARRAGSETRAATNIRYDPQLITRLRDAGAVTVEFDAEYDDLDQAVRTALVDVPDATVLYQTGGFGVEPIIYLLAPSATEAAERVRELIGNE